MDSETLEGVLSGTKLLTPDPISSISCVVVNLPIWLVHPAYPADAQSDKFGEFDGWVNSCSSNHSEILLQCSQVHYPAERGHQEVLGVQPFLSRSPRYSYECPGFASRTNLSSLAHLLPLVHPVAISSPGKRDAHVRPSTWCKREHDSSDQDTFFHCPMVQFWCLNVL